MSTAPADGDPLDHTTSWHGNEQALSFGASAATYDDLRPGYPADTVRWALGSEPRRAVDLGAGTGKLTRVLVEAGHDVVAVEPDPLMRAQLGLSLPGVRVLAGSGEAVPMPDGSVDAVLVAQAWHWMDHGRAAVEVARVLRPGGHLVVLWNLRDPRSPLNQAYHEVVADLEPSLVGRAAADSGQRDRLPVVPDARLQADGVDVRPNPVHHDPDRFAALVGTWSYVALSPRRDELVTAARDLARRLAGPDGAVELAQDTYAYRFRRI